VHGDLGRILYDGLLGVQGPRLETGVERASVVGVEDGLV
jgi:hypothetical protein